MEFRIWSCCFALALIASGCRPQVNQSDSVAPKEQPKPESETETVHHGLPGPKGQPPPEIRLFAPPIELIAAGEHWDGGTIWMLLQDQREAKVILCVTQDAYESEIGGNSLFIGADNASETSARRPLSHEESSLLLEGLKSAVEPRMNEKLKDFTKKGYDPLEYQTQERFTTPEENRFSQDEWNVIYAAHALDRLETVENQKLADRAELAKRVVELESVDLASAAAKFQSKSGATRLDEWERLRPVLVAELRAKRSPDPRRFLTKLLGDGDAQAAKRNTRGTDSLETPAADSVLAYNLETDGNFFRDLVFHLGKDGGVSFGVVSIALPTPQETPHDRISKDEQDIADKLGAISINLGGGSLDGKFKQGYSLGLEGDEVTDETLRQAAKLTTLVKLFLSGPNVTDDRLAILSGHEYLASLDLVSTSLSDKGLDHLKTLPTLKFLTIKDAQITREAVEQLRKAAPQCEVEWQPE